MTSPLTVTKTLTGFSCAHRLWRAQSHCRFIHGYDRTFEITITAVSLDDNGWVFDFGGFKPIKKLLEDQFDHTLCVASDDPELETFHELHQRGVVDLRVMDHPGMEGAALWVLNTIDGWVWEQTAGRCSVSKVVARENPRNAVTVTHERAR